MMYMYLFDKKDQNITILVRVLFTWLVISKFNVYEREREGGGVSEYYVCGTSSTMAMGLTKLVGLASISEDFSTTEGSVNMDS